MMTDEQMIQAIIQSIQADDKLIVLIRASVTMNIPIQVTPRLQAICTLLGIDTNIPT